MFGAPRGAAPRRFARGARGVGDVAGHGRRGRRRYAAAPRCRRRCAPPWCPFPGATCGLGRCRVLARAGASLGLRRAARGLPAWRRPACCGSLSRARARGRARRSTHPDRLRAARRGGVGGLASCWRAGTGGWGRVRVKGGVPLCFGASLCINHSWRVRAPPLAAWRAARARGRSSRAPVRHMSAAVPRGVARHHARAWAVSRGRG